MSEGWRSVIPEVVDEDPGVTVTIEIIEKRLEEVVVMDTPTGRDFGFGFIITSAVDGAGKYRPVARFACDNADGECKTTLEKTLKSGAGINPGMIVKWARGRGWQVITGGKGQPGRATCPECAGFDIGTTITNLLEGDEVMPTPTLPKPVETVPALPSPTPPITSAVTPVTPLRSPTTEQRIQIRHLLEKNFDEELGYYVGGYSDQRIAEELGIPRIIVEELRERAYGPIKVTEAQLEAKRRYDELAQRINQVEEFHRELAAQGARDVEELRRELEGLRRDAAA